MKWEKTISTGNILTLIAMLGAVIGGWYQLKGDIASVRADTALKIESQHSEFLVLQTRFELTERDLSRRLARIESKLDQALSARSAH